MLIKGQHMRPAIFTSQMRHKRVLQTRVTVHWFIIVVKKRPSVSKCSRSEWQGRRDRNTSLVCYHHICTRTQVLPEKHYTYRTSQINVYETCTDVVYPFSEARASHEPCDFKEDQTQKHSTNLLSRDNMPFIVSTMRK
jgi:hypothetical protein